MYLRFWCHFSSSPTVVAHKIYSFFFLLNALIAVFFLLLFLRRKMPFSSIESTHNRISLCIVYNMMVRCVYFLTVLITCYLWLWTKNMKTLSMGTFVWMSNKMLYLCIVTVLLSASPVVCLSDSLFFLFSARRFSSILLNGVYLNVHTNFSFECVCKRTMRIKCVYTLPFAINTHINGYEKTRCNIKDTFINIIHRICWRTTTYISKDTKMAWRIKHEEKNGNITKI